MNQYKQLINVHTATLYIVPTPIGNMEDITRRALSILKNVDYIAVENIQHTGILLRYFSIKARLFTLNNYNEKQKANILLSKLKKGQNIALVSDAGTPLINDPGYYLVCRCHETGIRVVPLPGACAAITALSAAGIPSNRFCYEGFLPIKRKSRLNLLQILVHESRTIIFYESKYRLLKSLEDIANIFGPLRYVVIARELTKIYESLHGAPVGDLLSWAKKNDISRHGEIVILIKGYKPDFKSLLPEVTYTLKLLMLELPLKKAVALVSQIHHVKKNIVYQYALNKYKINNVLH